MGLWLFCPVAVLTRGFALTDNCAGKDLYALRRALRRWVADPSTADNDLTADDLIRPAFDPSLNSCFHVAKDLVARSAVDLFLLLASADFERERRLAMEPEILNDLWKAVQQSNWSQVLQEGWPLFSLLEMMRQKVGGVVPALLREARAETLITRAVAELHDNASIWGPIAAGMAQASGHCGGVGDAVRRAQIAEGSSLALPDGVLLPSLAALELVCSPADGSCAARYPQLCVVPPTTDVVIDAPWENLLRRSTLASAVLSVEGPIANSVLPSEAFAALTAAAAFGVDLIVESGLGNGGSLTFWCKAGFDVISVDVELRQTALDRASACGGRARLLQADGFEGIPRLVEANSNRSVMVFLDGPKGCVAVRLAADLLRKHLHVRLVALHDVHLISPRYKEGCGLHVTRGELVRAAARGGWLFTSDSRWFVKEFALRLDAHWSIQDRSSRAS